MASRPYFNKGIAFLEQHFDNNLYDAKVLQTILDELEHRNTARAQALKERIASALGVVGAHQNLDKPAAPQGRGLSDAPQQPFSFESAATVVLAQEPRVSLKAGVRQRYATKEDDLALLNDVPYEIVSKDTVPPVQNNPKDIISSWVATEVLSPQTYKKPHDLGNVDRNQIVDFEKKGLPWVGDGEWSRPKKRLYYHIVLGSIIMDKAEDCLHKAFGDNRPEHYGAQGYTPLAIATVGRNGCLVEDDPVVVSSFAWGLPLASQGKLDALSSWPSTEASLTAGVTKRLTKYDENDDAIALTEADIHSAFYWLADELDLRSFLVEPPCFIIRAYQWFVIKEPPAKPLLNSFFLHDLARASQDIESGEAGTSLRRYLGLDAIEEKIDLLNDEGVLEELTAPDKAPTGRWPGQGRHSLVLLQQAAVNIARQELKSSGIMGINGPPGTGKTTLLRDLVSSVLTDRAEALAKFDKPEQAFHSSGEKIRIGQAFCTLYRLDDSIKGHEMLVASSNNKAVENISKELPDQDALAEDSSLTYFRTISDETSESSEENSTWGLIAAVLGNSSNRYAFRNAIWGNDDTSLKHYLKAALGTPVPPIEEEDPDTGELTERPQRILEQEEVPSGPAEASRNWKAARKTFLDCQKKVRAQISQIEKARVLAKQIGGLRSQFISLQSDSSVLEGKSLHARHNYESVQVEHATCLKDLRTAQELLNTSHSARPGFFVRLFRTQRYKDWRTSNDDLYSRFKLSATSEEKASQNLNRTEDECLSIEKEYEKLKKLIEVQRNEIERAEQNIQDVATLIGPHFADAEFWDQPHDDRHKATPWLSAEVQRLRDETFEAAVRLHKAFIDAAARPLRHNLMAFFRTLSGVALNTPTKAALLPELWATLFLITPVISTTFASVGRMLGKLPNESLGWLFVDEAGQAVPQAAVGAIMRSKRALIVGDPLQIPPVVTLSPTLVGGISREFGVDTDIWAAPQASAQALADNASRFGTELERDTGSIWIGSPLLVHRRCENPMFKISNRIAYNNLMVHAVSEKPSQIRDTLGESSWFDVQGSASDKWCADEGRAVAELLHRLRQGGIVDPDIYIISPFRIVAQRMRELVRTDDVLMGAWTENPWKWVSERIGTVHTFQGKEAEAVILLLGAPNADQTGARNWAGSEPNLLNVAATRAKSALYVIGSRDRWKGHGHFQVLDRSM